MSRYVRSRRPLLLGDVPADPAVVEAKAPTPLLDEPLVKAGLTGAGIFHGYKRTGSILWALVYGLAARTAPVVTGGIVAAQGFGKKKES